MGGGGNRKEFGDAFDEADDESVNDSHICTPARN